jgi:hypothetical protein
VDVTIETHGPDHAAQIVEMLRGRGFSVERIDSP